MAFSPGSCPECRRLPGFTLIELLVCIAIIALLIGLMLPALGTARERSRSAACLARLHHLQIATCTYADAYKVPPVRLTMGIVDVLELPDAAWICPSDRIMEDWQLGSSYEYLAPLYMVSPPGQGLALESLQPVLAMRAYDQNDYLPVYWDNQARHENDRNVVYWDGRAERRRW
jgi:prepilin-type N-terminal cleavage/methylation domain-containing protein/prepilin-type processing-associated H-X9-DG protein